MVEETESKAGAVIAMATGGTQSVNGYQHARSGYDSGIDGITQAYVEEIC